MKNLLLALGFLSLASSSLAAPKTLINSGFNTAAYADILMDFFEWRGEDLGNLKVKVGVQVVRYEFLALSLGFQKTGFYDATYDMGGSPGTTKLDYRGPVVELHLIPSTQYSFSVAGSGATGFSFFRAPSAENYTYSTCNDKCNVGVERSRLEVKEFSVQGAFKLSRHMYVTLGLAQRETKGSVSFELLDAAGKNGIYADDPVNDWNEKSTSILFGLRGSNF